MGDFLVRLSNVVSHILFNYYFFLPFQVFLKLRHESKVEHIFVSGNSGKQFEIILVKFPSYLMIYHLFCNFNRFMCDEQTPRCMEKIGKIVEHCMQLGVANMLDQVDLGYL